MGFWKEFFSNLDEPAIIIETRKRIEIPMERVAEDKKIKELTRENIMLRKQLKMKYIDTKYKLIE